MEVRCGREEDKLSHGIKNKKGGVRKITSNNTLWYKRLEYLLRNKTKQNQRVQ